jgi:ADP-ribose pyrophosphatase
MLLLRHYRHGVGKLLWEIPGGMIDPGETALDAAARELVEETGYRAMKLEPLIEFHPEPAMTDHHISLFVGTELHDVGMRDTGDAAELLDARFFTVDELSSLASQGDLGSSWTVLALALTTDIYRSKGR